MKNCFATYTRSCRNKTECVAAIAVSLLMVASAAILAADNDTIEFASPNHSIVVTKDNGGNFAIAIDPTLVYQDGTWVGVSQNGKFVLRVRMIELVKDLDPAQKAGNDKGFADPLKLQVEYTKLVFDGTATVDGLPTFIRILTDEKGDFLLITTTSVPVQTDKEIHPVTATM